MNKIIKLKNAFEEYENYYSKFFLKQGSFSLHHSKEIDRFIGEAYEIVLDEFFEDFFSHNDKIPFCLVAIKHYSYLNLSPKENADLLFIYKDIKAYNIKPLMKTLINTINDVKIGINYQIYELNGLINAGKNDLKEDISHIRYICGSKILFKQIKEKITQIQEELQNTLLNEILNNFNPFYQTLLTQDFDINKISGGLNEQLKIENLGTIFKNSSKNYALDFIDEKEFSEYKLASDFLFSLKSAMNILDEKDTSVFLVQNAKKIAKLMQKKEKKNLDTKSILIQKALQSLQICGIYTHFLTRCMQITHLHINMSNFKVENNAVIYFNISQRNLNDIFKELLSLEDRHYVFDINLIFALKRAVVQKDSFKYFKLFLSRKHSYCFLKLFLDANILKLFCKPLTQSEFLLEEDGKYSANDRALLALYYFENEKNNYDEKLILCLKLVLILSAINEENEISLANIFRAYALKFEDEIGDLELGIVLIKNFNSFRNIVEKEDINNSTIILNFISKLNNKKSLEILYHLSLCNAKALGLDKHHYLNSFKELLENSLACFEDENLIDESQRRVKKENILKRSKNYMELADDLKDHISHIKSNLFFIKNTTEDIIKIANLAQNTNFTFWLSNKNNFTLELIMLKKDKLKNILNVLSSLNLVHMNLYELFEEKIYIKFEYDDVVDDEEKTSLQNLLNSKLNLKIQKKNKKPCIKKDELKFDTEYSKNYAKMTLNTKDQKGLMAYVMDVLANYSVVLNAAKIQTIRERTRNILILQKDENLQNNKEKILKSLVSE